VVIAKSPSSSYTAETYRTRDRDPVLALVSPDSVETAAPEVFVHTAFLFVCGALLVFIFTL